MSKFLHAMIRVNDIEKSLKFYTELLDLRLAKTMELEDCKLYFLSDSNGYTQVELTHNFDTPKDGYEIGNGFGHFAFAVKSMDEFGEKLNSLGYTYLYEPYQLDVKDAKGPKIAFVKDPNGYEIELIEE